LSYNRHTSVMFGNIYCFLFFAEHMGAGLRQKTEVVNVRVPDEIAGWIDSLVEKKLFSSRSEVVRHFLREYVRDQKTKTGNNYSSAKEGNK
jgi:hypothetical protein